MAVLIVVPVEELAAEVDCVVDADELAGERCVAPQRLELRPGQRVVVAHLRVAVARAHVEVGEQLGDLSGGPVDETVAVQVPDHRAAFIVRQRARRLCAHRTHAGSATVLIQR